MKYVSHWMKEEMHIPRLNNCVPAPYWNSTKNRLELGTVTMRVTVTRIPILNQFWQICLEWAKVHKTNLGMPKFGDFQMDHRCHSHHCVNTNHIVLSRICKLSEGVNTNFVRDKCVGPPFCKCGERGVPCLIPGINHKGYQCDELSVEDLVERKIIAQPKIFNKKKMKYLKVQSHIIISTIIMLLIAFHLDQNWMKRVKAL